MRAASLLRYQLFWPTDFVVFNDIIKAGIQSTDFKMISCIENVEQLIDFPKFIEPVACVL